MLVGQSLVWLDRKFPSAWSLTEIGKLLCWGLLLGGHIRLFLKRVCRPFSISEEGQETRSDSKFISVIPKKKRE